MHYLKLYYYNSIICFIEILLTISFFFSLKSLRVCTINFYVVFLASFFFLFFTIIYIQQEQQKYNLFHLKADLIYYYYYLLKLFLNKNYRFYFNSKRVELWFLKMRRKEKKVCIIFIMNLSRYTCVCVCFFYCNKNNP